MRFEQLLNVMHSDYYDIQVGKKRYITDTIYDPELYRFLNYIVIDFYTFRNGERETGLIIRLQEVEK